MTGVPALVQVATLADGSCTIGAVLLLFGHLLLLLAEGRNGRASRTPYMASPPIAIGG